MGSARKVVKEGNGRREAKRARQDQDKTNTNKTRQAQDQTRQDRQDGIRHE